MTGLRFQGVSNLYISHMKKIALILLHVVSTKFSVSSADPNSSFPGLSRFRGWAVCVSWLQASAENWGLVVTFNLLL